ncbi:MAG: hypothetical protein HYX94_03860 [Chloroflexi bacterium]|nr:hypothetical protein [Chloroflexota bacterium]
MFWRKLFPIIFLGLSAATVATVLVPRLRSAPAAITPDDKLAAEDTSSGICQQCHGTGSTEQADTVAALAGTPGPIHFEERFADGKLSLDWQTFPHFSPDLIRPVARPDAPGGDGWAGLVTDEAFGGFASLSYAGEEGMSDCTVEAWIYTEVTAEELAPIHGIAVRVDPKGLRFYRLAAQFRANPRLSFAYVGRDLNDFPDYLRTWTGDEIPGGAPTSSGWHRMGVRVEGDRFWLYWDGQELPGGPIVDGRIEHGYFGIYDNFVGMQKVANTLVDEITVR